MHAYIYTQHACKQYHNILCVCVAGLFNFIGLMTIGLNLGTLNTSPGYSLVLEALAVLCFFGGCAFGVLDMQGCCLRRPAVTAGKGVTRSI